MYDAKVYMDELIERLKEEFGEQLIYVGLQGSYLREEMTEESDIDPMVVLEQLSAEELRRYRSIINQMDQPEKSCGFICGRDQLANWNPMEVTHLLHSTKDLYGNLTELVPPSTREDAVNYCRIGLNNLYHFLCHRYIHSDADHNANALPGDYKMAFFLLQDLHYLRTGNFILSSTLLAETLEGEEQKILYRHLAFKNGAGCELEADYELLFNWCSKTMAVL